ncbi:MAG: hypothetical protein LiPW41_584 [Parcubacteria group bacterium LiPW_41]|nr:MAG: hypothetical protein LiPW41_584 [Parcubacteria group bacterium LiPW_41]
MSKLTYKIATASIAVMTIASLSAPAFAQVSTSDLQAQIAALQAQLTQLQGGSSASSYTFTKNLTVGAKGEDVKQLQSILIAGGYLKIAAPTSFFGPATKAAVIAWQKAVGISPTSGFVGALSRAKLNGSSVVTPGVPATDSYLKVEVVPSLGGTIPSSSLYNKVLNLKLTAGKDAVVVTGITATRGGYIANTRINGVSAWDEAGKRYGNIVTSLTSDGKVTVNFGSDPMTVPAGTTKNLSVAINLDSTATSASVNFGLMSASDIKVSGTAPVQGTFPMIGGTYSVVDGSASLGDVRVSNDTVSGMSTSSAQTSSVDGNVDIGDTQREVFKLKLTQNNSKEAVYVKNVTLYVGGNIVESTDIKNWKLYSQEGTVLATAERSIDRNVTFNLATPYMIDKGLSRTLPVKADIVDGSGRYFQVFVQNDYDLVVTGATTGSSVLLTDSSGGSLTQSDTQDNTSGYFKMKQGGLTVSKSPSSPSGSIAPSATNVVLGSFDVKSSGEQLELRKMAIRVVRSAAAPVLTGSITVKDATTGETYYSVSADTTGLQSTTTPSSWSSSDQMTLSSYIPLSSNQTRTLQVLGSVSSAATSGTYKVHIGDFYAKRFSTNDYQDVATGVTSANQLSLQDVTLTVTKNASFANTNRAAGATNVKVAEFNLQGSSADDIQVNTISLNITTSTNFQNVKVMDGTTQLGNTVGTPSATGNSFTVNLVVAKSATKLISVYADIVSSATGNSVVSIAASGVSGYGKDSGKALSSTPVSATPGQTIAIGTPSVTIASSDNSALTSKVLIAGTTGVSLGDIKFSATNEDLVLRKITLNLTSASTSLWSQDAVNGNFVSVKLYDGSTELGSSSVVSGVALITIPEAKWVTLPQGSDKILTVKADLSANTAISSQSVFRATVTSSSTTNLEISSASLGIMDTGVTISSAATNYYKVQAVAPTIAAGSGFSANTVGAADSEIGRVTVGKQGDRNVILTGLTLRVQMTGAHASSSITTFTLKDGDSGATVATTSQTLSGPSGSTSTVFTFASTTITTTKTYKLFADTSNIRTGVASTDHPNVLVDFVMPATGYSSSDTADLWTDANVTYGYDIYNPTLTTYSGLKNMNKNSDNADTIRLGTNTY